jgi:carbon monoxide dehydrogenase subunit G
VYVKQYTQTFHVDVPPENAFAVVVDPEAQQSRFMKVEVVEETPDGVGTTLRYYYQVLGRRLGGGTYKYSEYVPGERFTWEFSGGVGMLLTGGPVSSTITFEPADGGTDVTIHPEFKTRIPVVNDLVRGIMMRTWRRGLSKWKVEIEERAKGRTAA